MVLNMYENSDDYNRELIISETNTVDSRAQLIGAEFPADFELNGIFHSIAVMDKEKCFNLYLQQIQKNNIQTKSLLGNVQTSTNFLTKFYCSKEAVENSRKNELLCESAYILKNSMNPSFEESKALFSKSAALFEKYKNGKYVKISVVNDYDGIILRTLKNQMELLGFSVSDSEAKTVLSATLNFEITKSKITEEYTEYFAYTGLEISAEDLSGKSFFTYTRNFSKEGGLSENQLLKRACTKVEKEINTTFCSEFKEKLSL